MIFIAQPSISKWQSQFFIKILLIFRLFVHAYAYFVYHPPPSPPITPITNWHNSHSSPGLVPSLLHPPLHLPPGVTSTQCMPLRITSLGPMAHFPVDLHRHFWPPMAEELLKTLVLGAMLLALHGCPIQPLSCRLLLAFYSSMAGEPLNTFPYGLHAPHLDNCCQLQ